MALARVAIVGATGEVGRAVLGLLEDSQLELELVPIASGASDEETVLFRGRPLLVETIDDVDFSGVQIAVVALPAAEAARWVPLIREAGVRVIDHSGWSRAQGAAIAMAGDELPDADWLATPHPIAAIMTPVLRVLTAKGAAIRFVEATVLSPVSADGRTGIRELAGQTGELLNARGIEPRHYPVQIAFNALPLAASDEEEQVMDALEASLGAAFPVSLSLVKAPVFYGLSLAMTVHFERQSVTPEVFEQAAKAAGLHFPESEAGQQVATPVTDASGQDGVYLTALAALPAPLTGLKLWVLADNVRQGAAIHSLFVIEKWLKRQ